jgi:nucleotide-binding universal stress UspA family protein
MSSYIIIAAVDYSDLGNAALDAAINLSGLHVNSEIHILHVDPKVGAPTEDTQVGSDSLAHSDAALDHLEAVCNERLAKFREEHGEPHVKRLSTHFRYGKPAKEIVQLAADFSADVVLVGTHGRTGLKRFVLGSVAEKVVRNAPCPVLVIRDKKAVPASEQLDAIEPLCEGCKKAREESAGQVVWCKRHSEPRHINTHRYTYGYKNPGQGGVQSTRLGASS